MTLFPEKREQKKHKVVCCLPSCDGISRRKCIFASVSDIYTACDVSSVSSGGDSSRVISVLRILLFLVFS